MTEIRTEKRRFTRVELALPVQLHQGGSVWHQRLIDISLNGVATDQPDVWDAQYNEPFTLIIELDEGSTLELHAYLQHVEADRLGFSVQHVDRENIEPLRAVLEAHMDLETLEEELKQLG
ncbi:MAG: PilZ domain-containing protein [Gammaproteobacteria bacterium]|nr:MAG: PilZ domain-containing protein [Gammaproteobacteria bacterium]RLA59347.1 MAG: PilZ domain-containing protein [Gammaproteobacteria bacterium]